jgi:hypothetical protein
VFVSQASQARYATFFFGTFAPFLRASERPIAIACFRLLTRPLLPPLPERSVPRFSQRTALATLSPAALPYLRRPERLCELELFVVAISCLRPLRGRSHQTGCTHQICEHAFSTWTAHVRRNSDCVSSPCVSTAFTQLRETKQPLQSRRQVKSVPGGPAAASRLSCVLPDRNELAEPHPVDKHVQGAV